MSVALQGVLDALIGASSAIIVLLLNERIKQKEKLKSSKQERLDSLYIPFYSLCIKGFVPEYRLLLNKESVAKEFLDLFINNLSYMDTKTQSLVFDFYKSFLGFFHYNESVLFEYTVPKQSYDQFYASFNNIGISLQNEHSELCKYLGLPPPMTLFK